MGAGEFFGAARMQLRSEHFTVSAVTHLSARKVPPHAHAHAFFSMLVSGQYRESFGEQHWEARPLSMVLRPAQVEHHDEIGPRGAVFLCVDIAPIYCMRLRRRVLGCSGVLFKIGRCRGWRCACSESFVRSAPAGMEWPNRWSTSW